MAAKQKEKSEPQLDQDGIVIVEYAQSVLVIVTPDNFGEQGVCQARSMLQSVRIGTRVASSRTDEVLKGRLQDFFLADEGIADVDVSKYSGVIIASGQAGELAGDPAIVKIVQGMGAANKMVASIGNGLEVLIRAGVVKGRRVTGDQGLQVQAQKAGANFTGRQIEISGNVVTALNENAGVRFGRGLIEVMAACQTQ